MEKAVLPFEKKLPSTDIDFFVVTPEVVTDPRGTLDVLLANPDDPELHRRHRQAFAEDRAMATQAVLTKRAFYLDKYAEAFTDTRIDLIVTWHLRAGIELERLFETVVSMVDEVRGFESFFADKQNIRIRFSEDAVDEILGKVVAEGGSAIAVCRQVSSDYDYALKLVMEKTGQQEFLITKEAILDPDGYINDMIRKSYGSGPFAIPGPREE
jgi:hypothetical protein